MTITEQYGNSTEEDLLYQIEWRQYYIDHYRLPYRTKNYTEIAEELKELRKLLKKIKIEKIERSNNQKTKSDE